jgi:probable phosphoglycerate mutase
MGHGPVPLSAVGRDQVARLAERLAEAPPDRVIASDIARAVESAEIITRRLGVSFDTHPELREIDVGEAKGASYAEAAERWPSVFRAASRSRKSPIGRRRSCGSASSAAAAACSW